MEVAGRQVRAVGRMLKLFQLELGECRLCDLGDVRKRITVEQKTHLHGRLGRLFLMELRRLRSVSQNTSLLMILFCGRKSMCIVHQTSKKTVSITLLAEGCTRAAQKHGGHYILVPTCLTMLFQSGIFKFQPTHWWSDG